MKKSNLLEEPVKKLFLKYMITFIGVTHVISIFL